MTSATSSPSTWGLSAATTSTAAAWTGSTAPGGAAESFQVMRGLECRSSASLASVSPVRYPRSVAPSSFPSAERFLLTLAGMAPPSSAPMPVPRRPPPLALPADDSDSLPRSIDCIAGCISPLKDAVRTKWATASARRSSCGAGGLPTPSAASALAQRLAAADARREAFRTWTMRRANASAAPRRALRAVKRGQTEREGESTGLGRDETDSDAERDGTNAVDGLPGACVGAGHSAACAAHAARLCACAQLPGCPVQSLSEQSRRVTWRAQARAPGAQSSWTMTPSAERGSWRLARLPQMSAGRDCWRHGQRQQRSAVRLCPAPRWQGGPCCQPQPEL